MVRHFEAIVAYLRDHDWVPDPKHASEDPILEIHTFLNGLIGLGIVFSPGANATLNQKIRKVTFEFDMPDAPKSSPETQLQKPMRNRKKFVKAVTTKTFSGGPCAILAVPWPVGTSPSPVAWCGIIPILDHEIMRHLVTHCAPWWWMWKLVPSSPDHQSWYTNHIYQTIGLSAKLSALRGHNALINKALNTFTTALTNAVAAAVPLAPKNAENYPDTASIHDFNQIILIHETQKRLLAAMELVLHHSKEIRRLIHLIKPILHQLLTLPTSSPAPPLYSPDAGGGEEGEEGEEGEGLTSPLEAITDQAPVLLLALAAVEAGVDRFARGMRVDTAQLLFAARTALEEGLLLGWGYAPPFSPPPRSRRPHERVMDDRRQQQRTIMMGLLLERDLERVRGWYDEVFATRESLAGVRRSSQLLGDCGEQAWEKVMRMGRWFVTAEGMYRRWCGVVRGLMGGVREMTRRV